MIRTGRGALLALAVLCVPAAHAQPLGTSTLLPPAAFGLFTGVARQGALLLGTAPAGTTHLTLDDVPIEVARDGRFLVAFDRDAGPHASLVAILADGRRVTKEFDVAPGEWRIERLDRVARTPVPDAEFERRRPAELEQIKAARLLHSDADGWRQRFIWPATGRISGLFGAQRIYRGEPGAYHGGVDIAKPAGAPVVAPADGVVILAAPSPFTLEGNLLMIDHGMGLNSAFLHLSKIEVRVGDHVRQGQEIGRVGATGRASGPHLHWAMMWLGRRIDPMRVAGAMAQ